MPIDKVLVKEIMAAKKPRHFAFVPGAAKNVLKMGRSIIPNDAIEQAKKDSGGKSAYIGRTLLEESDEGDETLVFYMKKADKTLEPKLKRAIKENAGLSRAVEVRPLGDLNVVDDGQDVPEEGAPATKAEYLQLSSELSEQVPGLQLLNPKIAAKVQEKLDEAAELIAQEDREEDRDYRSACKTLRSAKKLADKAPSKVSPEQQAVADKAEFKSLRDRLGARVEAFKVVKPEAVAQIENFLAKADALVGDDVPNEKKKYKDAIAILMKLSKFVDEGLRKNVPKSDKDVIDEANQAGDVPAKYEKLYRETKAAFKEVVALIPGYAKTANLANRLNEAAKSGQGYHFPEALAILTPLREEIAIDMTEYPKFLKKRTNLDTMCNQAAALTQPGFPAATLRHFRDYLESANKFAQQSNFVAAGQGLTALEERLRHALTERSTFAEATLETARLLHQAEGNLKAEDFDAWEARYLDALDQYDDANVSGGYDAVTTVGAELKNALRQAGMQDVRDVGKVKEMTEGNSRDARRLRFKLNADGVRKALPFIAKLEPNTANDFEKRFRDVLAVRKKSLTKGEDQLNQLLADIKAAMQRLRGNLPKGQKWDPIETQSEQPKPKSLKEWSEDIDTTGVLGKVKRGKKLGAGGFGGVYRLDPNDQHQGEDLPPLVVKIPNSEEELKGIEEEAELYKKLGDHPNIVKCLGMRDVNGERGMVMESVRGKTTDEFTKDLRARLQAGKITQAEFWSTIQYTLSKTLGALSFMHDKGLSHNDVKPQNIMVDSISGDIKLLDIGLANPHGDKVGNIDNPTFRSPEQMKTGESSPQTDALAVGAVGYTGVGDAPTFHFGDKEGMNAPQMFTVEETVRAYGDLIGDENAIGLSNQPPRRVNERGEDDPQGTILVQDPSTTSNRSAFSDFMNAILHPDPNKRLSPKQALEHPFLRDMILSEEQVRGVIQRSTEEPDQTIPGDEPGREILSNVVQGVENKAFETTIQGAKDAVANFDVVGTSTSELLTTRERFVSLLATYDDEKRKLDRGVILLSEIVANARLKDTEGYFKDNRNLAAMKKLAADFEAARPDVQRVIFTIDRRIAQAKEELAGMTGTGGILGAEEIQKRIKDLEKQRGSLTGIADDLLANPQPMLFARFQSIERAQDLLVSIQANTLKERQNLVIMLQKLGSGGGEASPEVKALPAKLTEHIRKLTEIDSRLKLARQEVEREVADVNGKVDLLDVETTRLFKEMIQKRSVQEKAGLEFEELARKPKNTVKEQEAFAKAREDMDKSRLEHQTALKDLDRAFDEHNRAAVAFQRQLGQQAVPGLPDPLNKLTGIVNRISEAKKQLTVS